MRKIKIFDISDKFIFLSVILLILLTFMIILIVSNFMIKELTDLAINDLFNKQDKIIDIIKKETEDTPRLLTQTMKAYMFSGENKYKYLFENIKSQFRYCKYAFLAIYNDDGTIKMTIDDFEWKRNFNYIKSKRSKDNKIISYSNNSIIYIGYPYRDIMDVNSIVPIFIDFYDNMKIKYTIFLEINITMIINDAKQNIVNISNIMNDNYAVFLYTSDFKLIETTENYPLIKIETLAKKDEYLDLISAEEKFELRSFSYFYRKTQDKIEFYNNLPIGYIMKGAFPYNIILKKVNTIKIMIICVAVVIIAFVLILEQYSINYGKSREREKILTIETIRSKLNPHFVFNTLNSMVCLVIDKDYDTLLKAFKSLSLLLRSCLILNENFITLNEELEYIDNYIELQKIRYSDVFDYHKEINEKLLLKAIIPRFTIQPIIENCFVHAIAVNSDDKFRIQINVNIQSEHKDIYIDISNNGICSSFEKKEIEQNIIKAGKNSPGEHMGLYLINNEIKILYGSKYGIRLLNIDDENIFSVRVKLPAEYDKKMYFS